MPGEGTDTAGFVPPPPLSYHAVMEQAERGLAEAMQLPTSTVSASTMSPALSGEAVRSDSDRGRERPDSLSPALLAESPVESPRRQPQVVVRPPLVTPAVALTEVSKNLPPQELSAADRLIAQYSAQATAHDEVARRRKSVYTARKQRLWQGVSGTGDTWDRKNRLGGGGADLLLLLVRQCTGALQDTFEARELLRIRCARRHRAKVHTAARVSSAERLHAIGSDDDTDQHWNAAYDATTATLLRAARTLSAALRFVGAASQQLSAINSARRVLSELWREAQVPLDAYANGAEPQAPPDAADPVRSGILTAPLPGPAQPALWFASSPAWTMYNRPDREPETPKEPMCSVRQRRPQTCRQAGTSCGGALLSRWRGTLREATPVPPLWIVRQPDEALRQARARAAVTPDMAESLEGQGMTAAVEADALAAMQGSLPLCRAADTPDADAIARAALEEGGPQSPEPEEPKEEPPEPKPPTLWDRVAEVREKRKRWYRQMTLDEKEQFIIFNKVEMALHRESVRNCLRRVMLGVALRLLDRKVEAAGGSGPFFEQLRLKILQQLNSCRQRKLQVALDRAQNFKHVRFLDSGRYAEDEKRRAPRPPEPPRSGSQRDAKAPPRCSSRIRKGLAGTSAGLTVTR